MPPVMTVLAVSLVALGLVFVPDAVLATIGTSQQYELDLIRWLGLATALLFAVESAGRRWARPVSPPSVVLRLLLPAMAVVFVISGDAFYLIVLFSVLAGTALLRALVTIDHLTGGIYRSPD